MKKTLGLITLILVGILLFPLLTSAQNNFNPLPLHLAPSLGNSYETSNEQSSNDPKILEAMPLIEMMTALSSKHVNNIKYSELVEYLEDKLFEYPGLDKHTRLIRAIDVPEFSDRTEGSYYGIGAVLSQNDDGYLIIERIYPGGSAFKSLVLGDIIIEIDGVNISDLGLKESVSLIKGELDTEVNLKIKREEEIKDVVLTRKEIKNFTVEVSKIENTLYIKFGNFSMTVKEEILNKTKNMEYDSVILDVRNNPGGLLISAAEIVDLFVDEGVIVYSKNKNNETDTQYWANEEITYFPEEMPVVVLINENSASASEILAGSLKDHNRALLIGRKTYGKGSVQTGSHLLSSDDLVMITTSKYYLPNDESIDGVGITPDIDVGSVGDFKFNPFEIDLENDLKLSTAMEYIRESIR